MCRAGIQTQAVLLTTSLCCSKDGLFSPSLIYRRSGSAHFFHSINNATVCIAVHRCLSWDRLVNMRLLLKLLLRSAQLLYTRTEQLAFRWPGLSGRNGHWGAHPLVFYHVEKRAAPCSGRAGCSSQKTDLRRCSISW